MSGADAFGEASHHQDSGDGFVFLYGETLVAGVMESIVRNLEKPGALVTPPDSRQFRSGYVVLQSGEEVGEHQTESGEELIVFMQGTADASYGGRIETIRAPAVALVPAHTSHNVTNNSQAPLHYVYVYNMSMDRT
jgi:mannose-6-phosphate isomerase-like protein (cupin superfamily)